MVATPEVVRSALIQIGSWHYLITIDERGIVRAQVANVDGTPREDLNVTIRRWALGLWGVPPLDGNAARPFLWNEQIVTGLEEGYQELGRA